MQAIYAKSAHESCEKIIKVWNEDPLKICEMEDLGHVFEEIHRVSLESLRDGSDPRDFLITSSYFFRKYSESQLELMHAYKHFYLHIFLYAMIFQSCFSYFFSYMSLWLILFVLTLNLSLFLLAPKTKFFSDLKNLSLLTNLDCSHSNTMELINNSTLVLSRENVEQDLKDYNLGAQRLIRYMPILELLFCGPLLFIFGAYLLLTDLYFSVF